VWQQRNDVRIPPDTGSEFSIVDPKSASSTRPYGDPDVAHGDADCVRRDDVRAPTSLLPSSESCRRAPPRLAVALHRLPVAERFVQPSLSLCPGMAESSGWSL
jgi:hypothetical protein